MVERSSGPPAPRPPGTPTGGGSAAMIGGGSCCTPPSGRGAPGALGLCDGSNTSARRPPGGGDADGNGAACTGERAACWVRAFGGGGAGGGTAATGPGAAPPLGVPPAARTWFSSCWLRYCNCSTVPVSWRICASSFSIRSTCSVVGPSPSGCWASSVCFLPNIRPIADSGLLSSAAAMPALQRAATKTAAASRWVMRGIIRRVSSIVDRSGPKRDWAGRKQTGALKGRRALKLRTAPRFTMWRRAP